MPLTLAACERALVRAAVGEAQRAVAVAAVGNPLPLVLVAVELAAGAVPVALAAQEGARVLGAVGVGAPPLAVRPQLGIELPLIQPARGEAHDSVGERAVLGPLALDAVIRRVQREYARAARRAVTQLARVRGAAARVPARRAHVRSRQHGAHAAAVARVDESPLSVRHVRQPLASVRASVDKLGAPLALAPPADPAARVEQLCRPV